ncbi:hypothetical protein ACFL96_09720 [Thermoproteota archaeon]
MRHKFTTIYLILLILSTNIVPVNGFIGTWTKTYVTSDGNSSYTFVLESQEDVKSNSNWTLISSLNIDDMDLHKQFVFYITMEITIETDTGTSIKRTISYGHYPIGAFPDRIYPGGRWGPNTIHIDLSNEILNIPFGGSTDATIYVKLNIAEFVNNPFLIEQLPTTTFETFQFTAGSIKIISDSNIITDYLSYILGAIVGIMVFTGLVIRDIRINKQKKNIQ